MEPKKNPKADVSRNGSVYFAVGLALMLFVTYSTINYKTYDKEAIDIGMVNMDELDDEEIPITEQIQTPPPPPPPPAAPAAATPVYNVHLPYLCLNSSFRHNRVVRLTETGSNIHHPSRYGRED